MDRPGLDREDEDGPGAGNLVEHHFPPQKGQKWSVKPKFPDVSGCGIKIDR